MINFDAALKEDTKQSIAPINSNIFDIEKAKKHFEKYIEEIDKTYEVAQQLKVEDQESNKKAVEIGTSAKKLYKKIEETRKSIIEEPNSFVKSVNSFARIFTDKLKSIEQLMKQKISQYRAIEEQKRREAELKAKKAIEELQKKLEKEAKEKGIEPVKVEAPVIPAEPKITRTESGSASGRKVWTFEVVNIDEVPREYLSLNEKKVRDAVRAGVREIPGIRIFQKEKTTFRAN